MSRRSSDIIEEQHGWYTSICASAASAAVRLRISRLRSALRMSSLKIEEIARLPAACSEQRAAGRHRTRALIGKVETPRRMRGATRLSSAEIEESRRCCFSQLLSPLCRHTITLTRTVGHSCCCCCCKRRSGEAGVSQ